MLARPTNLKDNTKAAKRNLRDEYLSIFPELLKAISNDKGARRKAAATSDATTKNTIADSEALIDAVFPISCIMKSQSFMGTEEIADSENYSATRRRITIKTCAVMREG